MGVKSGPRIPSRGSEFELIKGGTFEVATDITDNWTAFTSTTLSLQSSGSPGNCMRTLSGSGVRGGAYQDIGTIVGQVYKIIVHMNKGTSGTVAYFVGTTGSERTLIGASYETDSTASGWTRHENEFTASATTTRVSMVSRDSASTDYSEFDAVSVKPVDSPLILSLDAGLNRSTNAMADAGHPTKAGLTYGGPGVEEDYQPTGCKLITRADKTITENNDLRKYDNNVVANWAGAVTGGGISVTYVDGINGFYGYLNTGYGFTSNPVVGRRYRILMRVKTNTGSIHLRFYDGAGGYHYFSADVGTTMKTYTHDFTCQHATGTFVYGTSSFTTGEVAYFDRYEVYELTPWLDVSGYGNHATPELGINGLTIEDGTDKRGQGLKYFDLDGTDDYIDCGSNAIFDSLKPFTACIWFKMSNLSSDMALLSKGTYSSAYSFFIQARPTQSGSDKSYHARLTTDGSSSTVVNGAADNTWVADTWYHLVLVANGTHAYFYQNGEENGAKTAFTGTIGPGATAGTFKIGRLQGDESKTLDGQAAVATFYNAALTHAQVKDMYNSQRSRFGL